MGVCQVYQNIYSSNILYFVSPPSPIKTSTLFSYLLKKSISTFGKL